MLPAAGQAAGWSTSAEQRLHGWICDGRSGLVGLRAKSACYIYMVSSTSGFLVRQATATSTNAMGRRSQPPPAPESLPVAEAQAHYDLGFAYVEIGLRRQAVAKLEVAVRIDPLHRSAQQAVTRSDRLRTELGLPAGKWPKAKA